VVGKREIDLSISGRFDFSQVCLKQGWKRMKVRGGTISKKKQDSSGPDDSTLEGLRVTRSTYEWSEKQTRAEEQISGFKTRVGETLKFWKDNQTKGRNP
jgi:hypothetical protein